MTAILFMDTETVGDLTVPGSEIWEWAAIRREPSGEEALFHLFVEHDESLAECLPPKFQADHRARFDAARAVPREHLASLVGEMCADRPHIVGANPSYDTTRLSVLRRAVLGDGPDDDPWHYHLGDITQLAVGYLQGLKLMGAVPAGARCDEELADVWEAWRMEPPWNSRQLSRLLGVDPAQFAGHTAMGDVQWTRAVWDALQGGGVL